MPSRRRDRRAPTSPAAIEVWDQVAVGPGGTVRQTSWWDEPLRAYGVQPTVVAVERDGAVAGGALVRATGMRGIPMTIGDVVGGPLLAADGPDGVGGEVGPASEEVVVEVVDAIASLARAHRMVQLNLQVPHPAVATSVARALGTHGGLVRRTGQPPRAVVDLPDDPDALASSLSSHHRRRLRKAEAAGVEVVAVQAPADLRAAHRALEATAGRKGFVDLRPWPALEPAMAAGIERGAIEVLVARTPTTGDEVLGAIVLAHVADRTEYLYGGFVDAAASVGVTHPLHVAAMRAALARGIRAYDLGQLRRPDDPTGVDRFKLGFGASVVHDPDRIEWVRSPRLGAAITSLRRASWARAPLARIQALGRRRSPGAG